MEERKDLLTAEQAGNWKKGKNRDCVRSNDNIGW